MIELLRCLITGNPCGTDTRMIGSDCQCQTCAAHKQLSAQSAEIARLRDWLTNIKEIYEMSADIFTNDADLAGSLYDRARAALETKG